MTRGYIYYVIVNIIRIFKCAHYVIKKGAIFFSLLLVGDIVEIGAGTAT